MGAKGSKAKNEGIDENQWEKVGEIYNADIVASNKGKGQAELNRIAIEPRYDLAREKDIYMYRQNTNSSLVKCIGVEADKAKKTTLCGNQKSFKVLTERIPKRWHEMPQISFPESLYALSESLAGYEELHDKAGTFQISPTMMGVNDKGQMKVWLNENFANNHPSDERPNLQVTSNSNNYGGNNSQSRMVGNVIKIIEQKCENGSFPRDFKQVLVNNINSFENAQKSIEEYAVNHKIFIPSKLKKNYLDANGYASQVSHNLFTQQSNLNAIDYNSPTNRFTYDQSQSNNYQNGFYTSQNYQQRQPSLNNASSHAYHFDNQDSNSRKRYTYQEIPGSSMVYQDNGRVNTNVGAMNNQQPGVYQYTTYEHNRKIQPIPYQQIQRSQVTRQF